MNYSGKMKMCQKLPNNRSLIHLYNENDSGKWMLWFDKSVIDSMWKLATELLFRDKLKHIYFIKCSTNMKKQNQYNYLNPEESVILLYCNVPSDKESLKQIGNNIINQFNYTSKKTLSFKTDEQTRNGGKYTPIRIKNHLHKDNITPLFIEE